MTAMLTGAEKQALRARGQLMTDALRVGRDGATPAVVAELDRLLAARELVKLRFVDAERDEREGLATQLAEATGSACVGMVGRTALFYRRPAPQPASE